MIDGPTNYELGYRAGYESAKREQEARNKKYREFGAACFYGGVVWVILWLAWGINPFLLLAPFYSLPTLAIGWLIFKGLGAFGTWYRAHVH